MPLEIDVTEMQSHEIIRILTTYPYGRLESKYANRVFWVSDRLEPLVRDNPSAPSFDGRFPPQQRRKSAAEITKGMADALGSMVQIPGRR